LVCKEALVKLVNLTPHPITLVTGDFRLTIPPSGQVARREEKTVFCGNLDVAAEGFFNNNFPVRLVRTEYGEVTGLPEPQPGTMYIVSAMVRQAVPDRRDVVSPGALVRDAEDKVIGCQELVLSPWR
jgi:hypothetical protein